jgi:multicomponent Na+:H+ antiporter subunit B
MRSTLLSYVARAVLPMILVFALFLLLRGHDAPGGGFIAGLVTSLAAVLAALALGLEAVQAALSPIVRPMPWIGLTIAAASGLPAVARGQSFLTHYQLELRVTEHLELQVATTLLFDVGVYLVVVGVASTVLWAFAGEAPP